MESEKEGIAYQKAYALAIDVVRTVPALKRRGCDPALANQLLRCGTSVGANLAEANAAFSKADFAAKMSISFKECRETVYWLSLLNDAGYMEPGEYQLLMPKADEVSRILYASLRTLGKIRN